MQAMMKFVPTPAGLHNLAQWRRMGYKPKDGEEPARIRMSGAHPHYLFEARQMQPIKRRG